MSETATPLLDWKPRDSDRHGETYDREKDFARLNRGMRRVFEAMKHGGWMTLREIAAASGMSETGASARFRDFRKPEMSCAYIKAVSRPPEDDSGVWEYRLEIAPATATH